MPVRNSERNYLYKETFQVPRIFFRGIFFRKYMKFESRETKKVLCLSDSGHLTLSWRRPLSYRNQSIDLRSKSVDWFLYDNGLRHERFNKKMLLPFDKSLMTLEYLHQTIILSFKECVSVQCLEVTIKISSENW